MNFLPTSTYFYWLFRLVIVIVIVIVIFNLHNPSFREQICNHFFEKSGYQVQWAIQTLIQRHPKTALCWIQSYLYASVWNTAPLRIAQYTTLCTFLRKNWNLEFEIHGNWFFSFFLRVVTGWSKVTVTNNISLTNLKNAKNCLTQWFLESFYAAVLVFWCLKMIRWEFSLHFNVEPNWWVVFSKTQPCMDWTLKYPQKTPKQLWHPQNTAQIQQDSSSGTPKTSSNSTRHNIYNHTYLNIQDDFLVCQNLRSWTRV